MPECLSQNHFVFHISISGAYSSSQTFGAIKIDLIESDDCHDCWGPKWRKKIARYVKKCSGKSEILSCFTGPISPPEIKNCCRHLLYTSLRWKIRPLHEAAQRGSQTQVGAPQLRSLRPDFAPADASVCSAFAAYHAQSGGPKNNFIAKHQASALPHLTMKRKV